MDFAIKDLKVWQSTVDFADNAFSLTENLQSNRKHYRLVEQLEHLETEAIEIASMLKGLINSIKKSI